MDPYWARETIDFKHIVNYVQKEIILVRHKNAYINLWFPSCLNASKYTQFLWSAMFVIAFAFFFLFLENK